MTAIKMPIRLTEDNNYVTLSFMENTIETTIEGTTIPAPKKPSLEEQILNLKKKISLLNNICNELNPYKPICNELKDKLNKFHIIDFEDPFIITNKLLVLLEDSIEELHSLQAKLKDVSVTKH